MKRKKLKRLRRKVERMMQRAAERLQLPTCTCGAFMVRRGMFLECVRGCGTTC